MIFMTSQVQTASINAGFAHGEASEKPNRKHYLSFDFWASTYSPVELTREYRIASLAKKVELALARKKNRKGGCVFQMVNCLLSFEGQQNDAFAHLFLKGCFFTSNGTTSDRIAQHIMEAVKDLDLVLVTYSTLLEENMPEETNVTVETVGKDSTNKDMRKVASRLISKKLLLFMI